MWNLAGPWVDLCLLWQEDSFPLNHQWTPREILDVTRWYNGLPLEGKQPGTWVAVKAKKGSASDVAQRRLKGNEDKPSAISDESFLPFFSYGKHLGWTLELDSMLVMVDMYVAPFISPWNTYFLPDFNLGNLQLFVSALRAFLNIKKCWGFNHHHH